MLAKRPVSIFLTMSPISGRARTARSQRGAAARMSIQAPECQRRKRDDDERRPPPILREIGQGEDRGRQQWQRHARLIEDRAKAGYDEDE